MVSTKSVTNRVAPIYISKEQKTPGSKARGLSGIDTSRRDGQQAVLWQYDRIDPMNDAVGGGHVCLDHLGVVDHDRPAFNLHIKVFAVER